MEKIILFGNGVIASTVYAYLTHNSSYQVAAFTVDRAYIKEPTMFGLPVAPFEDITTLYPPNAFKMLVSISYRRVNHLRAEKYAQAKAKGYQLINFVSPQAMVHPSAVLGDNCIISEGAVVQPFAHLGNDVHLGSGAIIGHHTVVKDHCFIVAGAVVLGQVTIEPYCFLGGNATVRDRLTIARETVIGAGAVILEDTREREVYLGRPADKLPVTSDELPLG